MFILAPVLNTSVNQDNHLPGKYLGSLFITGTKARGFTSEPWAPVAKLGMDPNVSGHKMLRRAASHVWYINLENLLMYI